MTTLQRSDAAFEKYLAATAANDADAKAYADAIRQDQWSRVERGEADMDTAFVLAVEAAS
jgi:hypothetical protein